MSQPTNINNQELQPATLKDPSSGAILYALDDHPRKKVRNVTKHTGIHEDYIDDALKGKPYGAKVIDLEEYRWMSLFDEM